MDTRRDILTRRLSREVARRVWGARRCHHVCKANPIFRGPEMTLTASSEATYRELTGCRPQISEANFQPGGRRTQGGERMTEDGGQTTDDRGRRTEDGGQKMLRRTLHEIRFTSHGSRATKGAEQSQSPPSGFSRGGGSLKRQLGDGGFAYPTPTQEGLEFTTIPKLCELEAATQGLDWVRADHWRDAEVRV